MRGIEQIVIIVLFVGVIALPFSRIIEFTHSKQSAEEQKLTQQEIAQQQRNEEAAQLQQLIDLILKEYSPKKMEFMRIVLPALYKVHTKLESDYKRVKNAIVNDNDYEFIKMMKKEYRVSSNDDLLKAIKPHPKSIALAQAAIESAWATSRFYREANNLFGVWSFDKNEPRIAASQSREGQTIWLRKYKDIAESIEDYYKTISTGFAYERFKEANLITDNPYELIKYLDRYSEKGQEYIDLLENIIKQNRFTLFD